MLLRQLPSGLAYEALNQPVEADGRHPWRNVVVGEVLVFLHVECNTGSGRAAGGNDKLAGG